MLLDVFVFAPLGFVLDLPHLVPEAIDRPIDAFEHASKAGRAKVGRTRRHLGRRLGRSLEHAQRAMEGLGLPVDLPDWLPGAAASADGPASDVRPRPNGTAPDRPGRPGTGTWAEVEIDEPGTDRPTAPDTPTTATASPAASDPQPVGAPVAVADADLAIPGYESLSASQVMPRLEGLTPAELEAVRVFEQQNRGRKTILSKIAQLQAS